ncbi:MAG: hypothetical protein ACFB5Z_18065 [Elainellaceae cyanobacterium]
MSLITRLEQYTLKRPQEVLLVNAKVDGEDDAIVVFRGFSSSLMRPTAFDPDVPILPPTADILAIDRLEGPYDPSNPKLIEGGLTREQIEPLLAQVGV